MAGLLMTVLLVPLALFLASPAHATEQTAELCVPDESTSCIVGTIRTEEGPVEGIDLAIADPAGTETTVTTDALGKWNLAVTEAGEYTVTIVDDSLPDGIGIVGKSEKTVNVKIGETRRRTSPLRGPHR